MKKLLALLTSFVLLVSSVIAIPMSAYAWNLVPDGTIAANETKTVTMSAPEQETYYTFTPTVDGKCKFYSTHIDNSGVSDTYATIYDSEGNPLVADDDSRGSGQFQIEYNLKKDNTYRLSSRPYSSEAQGSYKVTLEYFPIVEEGSITENEKTTININNAGEVKRVAIPDTLKNQCRYDVLIKSDKTFNASVLNGDSVYNYSNNVTTAVLHFNYYNGDNYRLELYFSESDATGDIDVVLREYSEVEEGELNLAQETTVTIPDFSKTYVYNHKTDKTGFYKVIVNAGVDVSSQLNNNSDSGTEHYYIVNISENTSARFILNSYSNSPVNVTFTVTELTPVDAGTLTTSTPVSVDAQVGNIYSTSFTPEKDGSYEIYTSKNGEYLDTYGYLIDADGNTITYDDDSAGNGQFKITRYLKKDTTYYIVNRLYNPKNSGTYNVNAVEISDSHEHSYASYHHSPTCTEKGYTRHTCYSCGYSYDDEFEDALGHNYQLSETPANCTDKGNKHYYCLRCGDSYDEETPALGHNWGGDVVITEPSCTEKGKNKHTCSHCDVTEEYDVAALGHDISSTVTPATLTANGSITNVCSKGDLNETKVIYRPVKFVLAKSTYVYTGKNIMPAVTVTDAQGKTIDKTQYTVTYSANKNVGTAYATITFKGNYKGTKKIAFKINPKSVSLSSVKSSKAKQVVVKWKKQTTQTTGYQIQYSTDKNFKKGNKTVTVSKNKTNSKTIKKLKSKKKYYLRIRTYKTVGKTKYYSSWSKSKNVKIK